MKMYPAISIFLFTSAMIPSAFSSPLGPLGDRVGNGGFAHVCRDPRGEIVSARLLDLWEAESLGAHASDRPVEIQAEDALLKLENFSPNSFQAVAYYYDLLKNAAVKTPRPLSKTDDAFPPYETQPGCAYEQVARYEKVLTETGTSGLRIDSNIYDSPLFSNSDRAALFIHEAIYQIDRLLHDAENSQRTRALTGHLMSDSAVPNGVRMHFSQLVGGDGRHPDKTPKLTTALALKDPYETEVELRVWIVDGVHGGNAETRGKTRYRCSVGDFYNTFPPRHHGYTEYLTAAELIKSADTSGKGFHLMNRHNEFTQYGTRTTRMHPFGRENSVGIACFKEVPGGRDELVEFAASVVHKDVECLEIRQDGSSTVHQGGMCHIVVSATPEWIKQHPLQLPSVLVNIVRGQ